MDNPPYPKHDAHGKINPTPNDDIGENNLMHDTDLANNDKPINFGNDIQVENSKLNKAAGLVQNASRLAKGGDMSPIQQSIP